jgi:hypothetical protein
MSQLELTDAQWGSFAAEFCKGFTKEQQDVCRTFCQIRGLLPGKHVVFNLRQSSEWDEAVRAKVKISKIIFITTIDASRLIAERTKVYNGQAPEQYIYLDADGSPSLVSEIPLPQLPLKPGQSALPREPWAVRTTVYRKDFSQPVSSIARFDAYASTYFDKEKNEVRLNDMWTRRGPEQLAKCSEMLSLRKAFPEELGGLYIAEEFKVENEEPATPASPTVAVSPPPPVPAVNQTPAVGTETARPGEAKTVYQVNEVPATLPAHSGDTLKVVPKETAKDKALAAVPDLKPASELPLPEKKKRGPKPKTSPNNGQVPGSITDADIPKPGEVLPEASVPDQQAATEFVETLDPTPNPEEKKAFADRVRALREKGAASDQLKNYILNVGKKSEIKDLTVGNWTQALGELEGLDVEKLKEVTKNAPMPAF